MDSVTSGTTMIDEIPGADRVSHGHTSLSLATTLDLQLEIASERNLTIALQQLVQHAVFQVPIFNLWDSISMIYTLCVEPINTNLRAELHLYQFRTIILFLSQHPYFRANRFRPTTAVATWSRQESSPGGSFPSTIAFGTTSCGDGISKHIMSASRVAFAKTCSPLST